jgi:hypothetical protein
MVNELKSFPTDLGSILVRMGAVTWDELHLAVEKQQWNREDKLGELLVKEGFIDEGTLKEALELQASLRDSDDVPLTTLQRIFNHAVDNYQRNNLRLAHVLDGKR